MVIAVQSFRVRGGRAQDVPGRAGVGVDPETSALDSNGVSKWPKHPHAPGNESDLRESYMFPTKPSYLVHRTVIAKCVLYMWYLKENKNRPYANELIAAVESPGINGGVLTFVWDCIRRASPGSMEVFARRLARHVLSLHKIWGRNLSNST